jgi:outer membrane protein, multidrug efflux system
MAVRSHAMCAAKSLKLAGFGGTTAFLFAQRTAADSRGPRVRLSKEIEATRGQMNLLTKRTSLLLAGLLLAAGCTVGPNYKTPQTPMPESFGPLPAAPTSQPSTALAGEPPVALWWTMLNDPALNGLIEQAAQANHDVRIAAARVREARAHRKIVASGEYPSANMSSGYGYNRLSKNAAPFDSFSFPGFPWEFNNYQVGFDASWELDIFGGIRRSVQAANADLEATVEGQRGVVLSVLAEVALNYVELRGDQERYRIAQENLQTQRQSLQLTVDRRRVGTATQLDVSRASAQVSTTEATLPQIARQEWAAMYRLSVLVGKQPGELVETLRDAKPIPMPPAQVPVGLPAELLRRRPDIRRAERELAAATARIGVAKADLYPQFALNGSFAMQSSDTHNLFNWDSRTWNVGPSFRWLIFDAGRVRSAVKVRTAQQEEALITYEQTVLRAMEEVQDDIVAFTTEQERRQSLQNAVTSSQESVELAQELYRQGLADFLSVLDAQRQLFLAQESLVQSERALTTSLISLYKALGGGWDPPAKPS